jgi:hypothetical protein
VIVELEDGGGHYPLWNCTLPEYLEASVGLFLKLKIFIGFLLYNASRCTI